MFFTFSLHFVFVLSIFAILSTQTQPLPMGGHEVRGGAIFDALCSGVLCQCPRDGSSVIRHRKHNASNFSHRLVELTDHKATAQMIRDLLFLFVSL